MRSFRLRGRPGMTLVEVLAAIFILGVGMLAVLVLFPLGALKMAKSLQDSRCGTIAANADAIAIMFDLRDDATNVVPYIKDGVFPPGSGYKPADPNGRGYPVFVDPFYALQPGFTKLGPTFIDRVSPSKYATTLTSAERWFTFLDDDSFETNGLPKAQRQGRYTWAYLIKRDKSIDASTTNLYVIAYSGRSVQTPVNEEAYSIATNTPSRAGDTSLVLQWASGTQERPTLKRGGWVLDTTYKPAGYIHAEPYKVMEMTDLPDTVDPNTGATVSQIQIEVQPPLRDPDVQQVVVLTNAVEVFERGNGKR